MVHNEFLPSAYPFLTTQKNVEKIQYYENSIVWQGKKYMINDKEGLLELKRLSVA